MKLAVLHVRVFDNVNVAVAATEGTATAVVGQSKASVCATLMLVGTTAFS